jgi:hypothetical protein
MSDLINLIYGSSATQLMSNDALLELLKKAREKNRRLGITGMLLYRGGNFLQVLEGERDVVIGIYNVIKADKRHHLIELIAERPVSQRGFGEWEMGFVHLDTIDLTKVEGYTAFLNEPLNSGRFKDMNFAYTFLFSFR